MATYPRKRPRVPSMKGVAIISSRQTSKPKAYQMLSDSDPSDDEIGFAQPDNNIHHDEKTADGMVVDTTASRASRAGIRTSYSDMFPPLDEFDDLIELPCKRSSDDGTSTRSIAQPSSRKLVERTLTSKSGFQDHKKLSIGDTTGNHEVRNLSTRIQTSSKVRSSIDDRQDVSRPRRGDAMTDNLDDEQNSTSSIKISTTSLRGLAALEYDAAAAEKSGRICDVEGDYNGAMQAMPHSRHSLSSFNHGASRSMQSSKDEEKIASDTNPSTSERDHLSEYKYGATKKMDNDDNQSNHADNSSSPLVDSGSPTSIPAVVFNSSLVLKHTAAAINSGTTKDILMSSSADVEGVAQIFRPAISPAGKSPGRTSHEEASSATVYLQADMCSAKLSIDDRLQSGDILSTVQIVDLLFAEYGKDGRIKKCCILERTFLCPIWYKRQIDDLVDELDILAGSKGATLAKLAMEKIGDDNVSIRTGKCIVRNPSGKRDSLVRNIECSTCRTRHRVQWQRGFFNAVVLGRFDEKTQKPPLYLIGEKQVSLEPVEGSINIRPALEILAGAGLVGSHSCHNSPCSDPFHVNPEDQGTNLSRDNCRPQRLNLDPTSRLFFPKFNKTCPHIPCCRPALEWPAITYWTIVKAECDSIIEQTGTQAIDEAKADVNARRTSAKLAITQTSNSLAAVAVASDELPALVRATTTALRGIPIEEQVRRHEFPAAVTLTARQIIKFAEMLMHNDEQVMGSAAIGQL